MDSERPTTPSGAEPERTLPPGWRTGAFIVGLKDRLARAEGQAARYRAALEALLQRIDEDRQAGICWTDVGQHCPFCSWHDQDFESLALHDEDCPFGKLPKLLLEAPDAQS